MSTDERAAPGSWRGGAATTAPVPRWPDRRIQEVQRRTLWTLVAAQGRKRARHAHRHRGRRHPGRGHHRLRRFCGAGADDAGAGGGDRVVLLGLGWSLCTVSASTLLSESAPLDARTDVQGAADLVMGLVAAAAGVIAVS